MGGVSAVEWWFLGWGWRGLRERWGRLGLGRGKGKGERRRWGSHGGCTDGGSGES